MNCPKVFIFIARYVLWSLVLTRECIKQIRKDYNTKLKCTLVCFPFLYIVGMFWGVIYQLALYCIWHFHPDMFDWRKYNIPSSFVIQSFCHTFQITLWILCKGVLSVLTKAPPGVCSGHWCHHCSCWQCRALWLVSTGHVTWILASDWTLFTGLCSEYDQSFSNCRHYNLNACFCSLWGVCQIQSPRVESLQRSFV